MPLRSLHPSVLRWPDRAEVMQALAGWAQPLELPGLVAVGSFGSSARGEAGVGSDLDVLVIVEESALPFGCRMAQLPLEELPVPADAPVDTREEWERLASVAHTLPRCCGGRWSGSVEGSIEEASWGCVS